MNGDRLDTDAIRETLRATAPRRSGWWERPLLAAAVIAVCITLLSLVANVALYQWGSARAEQLDELRQQLGAATAENACRAQIAADDAVAQANKALTSQRLIELAAASVLARDETLPEAERQAWRDASRRHTAR
jgi:hypothetical protein